MDTVLHVQDIYGGELRYLPANEYGRIQSALWGQGFVRGPPLPRRKKSAAWKEEILPEEARQISHLAAAHELLTAREAAASLIQGQKTHVPPIAWPRNGF